MTSSVQSLEISYFIQMTEDEEKVGRAVSELVGGYLPVERVVAEGHHGNVIVWVRYHVTGDGAEEALKRLVAKIGGDERRAILGDLGSLLDEHNALYIRLSKQVLVMSGNLVLASSDPIRVKVKPRAYLVRGDPEGFYARIFGEATG